MAITAHEKALIIYNSGDGALHAYLADWKAGNVEASTSRMLDIIHAYTLLQAHATQEDIVVGDLRLCLSGHQVEWKGVDPFLTVAEFKVVKLLVDHAGAFVDYRAVYNVVHYVGFNAGPGDDGYRGNVRSLIKRMRQKFRKVDSEFGMVENMCGHGYRWRKLEPVVPLKRAAIEQADLVLSVEEEP